MPTKRELDLEALHVEHKLIGEAVGSQDQVAVPWGGFNRIRLGIMFPRLTPSSSPKTERSLCKTICLSVLQVLLARHPR